MGTVPGEAAIGLRSLTVKEVEVSISQDDKTFSPAGKLQFAMAPGSEDYQGEIVKFAKPMRARYFKFQIKSNYRGGEMSGMAEIRFSNADQKAPPPAYPLHLRRAVDFA